MFDRTDRLILGLALLAAIGGGLLQRQTRVTSNQPRSLIGQTLPNLALSDLQGKARRLSEWQGHPLLLNFWASWCGPCLDEMPALDRLSRNSGENATIVIGIAMDEPARVRAYLSAHPVDYPVLLGTMASPDTSLQAGDSQGVLPYSALIGADGRVLATHVGALPDDWLIRQLAAASKRPD
jgi:thiol-disulfide isomerase/thioredoxin